MSGKALSWILICALLLVFAGGCDSSTVESGESQNVTVEPEAPETGDSNGETKSKTQQPGDDEVLQQVQEAHALALNLFTKAFEEEQSGKKPQPWSEIRPLLLQHFSRRMVDDNFASFYKNSLNDWGYEMLFAFPLADQDLFISLEVENRTVDTISIVAVTLTGYDELDTLRHTLIEENGSWVVDR